MSLRHAQAHAFEAAERVADAVLFEGYVLYPYRASAAKNRMRWQFGVVAPKSPSADGEPWFSQTECLAETAAGAELAIRIRCLRPQRQQAGAQSGWLEGAFHAIDLPSIPLDVIPIVHRYPLVADGVCLSAAVALERADRYVKIRVTLENAEPWREAFASDRDAMLCHSLAGAHLMLAIEHGAFVSLLEPPDAAVAAVAACENRHVWPVLAGERPRRDLMLASPIVLYDYPAVAPESRGDLFDAAEIDEILSLRILTMTDDEKREARATDPRARQVLDRVEALTPEAFQSLHGTMRSADLFTASSSLLPGEAEAIPPDEAFVWVGAHRVARGSHVRLRPNRRADSMDMFLRDQPATVTGVFRDFDDRTYVAVTIDADPAASLHESFGRFFYFDPSEVEPL